MATSGILNIRQNGEWVPVESIVGPTGPTGARGEPGENGNDGESITGPTGAPGTPATVAVAGAQYTSRDGARVENVGTPSNARLYFYLPAGATGERGPTGPLGPTGPANGPTGPTGPTGPANGPTGPTGPTGPATVQDLIASKSGNQTLAEMTAYGEAGRNDWPGVLAAVNATVTSSQFAYVTATASVVPVETIGSEPGYSYFGMMFGINTQQYNLAWAKFPYIDTAADIASQFAHGQFLPFRVKDSDGSVEIIGDWNAYLADIAFVAGDGSEYGQLLPYLTGTGSVTSQSGSVVSGGYKKIVVATIAMSTLGADAPFEQVVVQFEINTLYGYTGDAPLRTANILNDDIVNPPGAVSRVYVGWGDTYGSPLSKDAGVPLPPKSVFVGYGDGYGSVVMSNDIGGDLTGHGHNVFVGNLPKPVDTAYTLPTGPTGDGATETAVRSLIANFAVLLSQLKDAGVIGDYEAQT